MSTDFLFSHITGYSDQFVQKIPSEITLDICN